MKTSVILSAYNGEKYLRGQLDSIVNQTRKPDELIIIDDKSPDNGRTLQIIDEYCHNYSFVKKHENARNMGWAASFMNGTTLVSDDVDIIFFCDQDDIWEHSKIEQMLALFENEKVNVVISDCKNFDDKTQSINIRANSGSLISNKFSFDNHFIDAKGVGAAMALRKGFVDKYRPYWNETIGHDRFYQIMAIMFDKLYYFDSVCIFHRFHGDNATGYRTFKIESRIRGLEGNLELISSLEGQALLQSLSVANKIIIKRYQRFATSRLTMLKRKSIWMWLKMPIYGLSFYPTRKTWIGDLRCLLVRG